MTKPSQKIYSIQKSVKVRYYYCKTLCTKLDFLYISINLMLRRRTICEKNFFYVNKTLSLMLIIDTYFAELSQRKAIILSFKDGNKQRNRNKTEAFLCRDAQLRFHGWLFKIFFHSVSIKNQAEYRQIWALWAKFGPLSVYWACLVWQTLLKRRFGTSAPNIALGYLRHYSIFISSLFKDQLVFYEEPIKWHLNSSFLLFSVIHVQK